MGTELGDIKTDETPRGSVDGSDSSTGGPPPSGALEFMNRNTKALPNKGMSHEPADPTTSHKKEPSTTTPPRPSIQDVFSSNQTGPEKGKDGNDAGQQQTTELR